MKRLLSKEELISFEDDIALLMDKSLPMPAEGVPQERLRKDISSSQI